MMYFALFSSVFLGAALGYFLKKHTLIAKLLLTFTGGFLLSITLLHVLPESFLLIPKTAGLYVLLGVLLQVVLEYLSKGAEHGHEHFNAKNSFPFFVFLGLFLHALVEGMAITNSFHDPLGIAIFFHKIPVALILYLSISKKIKNQKIQLLLILLFACATPIGMWLSNSHLVSVMPMITAIVAGILLHISTTILFEGSANHQFNWQKLMMILLGVGLGIFV